jgi:uncharacterized protein YggE
MRSSIAIALSILCLIGCNQPQPHYVVVDGKYTAKIPIDFIAVRISLDTSAINVRVANERNISMVSRLLQVLKTFGNPDSEFSTAGMSTTRWKADLKPSASYSGTFILREPDQYDDLLVALSKLGDVQVGIHDYGSFDRERYESEAYGKAVESARDQASMLLSKTGDKPGKLIRLLKDQNDPFGTYDNIDQLPYLRPLKNKGIVVTAEREQEVRVFRKTHYDFKAAVTAIYEIQ